MASPSPAQVAPGPHRVTVPTINSRQARPLVVAVLFTSIASTAVILRFIAKRMNRSRISLDDYFILASIDLCDSLAGSNEDAITDNAQDLIGVQLAWTLSLMFCKFSLLTFYIHIFAIRTFRYLAFFVAAIVSGWALSVVLETFLLCRPFAYNWDPSIKDFTCGDRNAAYIGAGSLNIATDLMVLCLPIPMVWNLQIPRRNKVILSAVFGMGLLYVLERRALRRAFRLIHEQHITWTVTDPLLWSMLEPCVGVTCACIPLMRPLLSRALPERFSRRANKYGEFKDSPSNRKGSSHQHYGNSRVHDEGPYPVMSRSGSVGVTTNEISSGRLAGFKIGKESDLEGFSFEELEAQRTLDSKRPLDRINVKTEFKVQHLG
ncbi:MAG: hypothetical protein Q9179_000475 [Wetmoreana sp. 5 TL-2023]